MKICEVERNEAGLGKLFGWLTLNQGRGNRGGGGQLAPTTLKLYFYKVQSFEALKFEAT